MWPIMLCGRRRRLTSTGSSALNNTPSFLPALPYPHQLDPREPPLFIITGFPIMLCGRRRQCTSRESPAQNNRPSFWPALPSPHQLGLREPSIVDQNWVAHQAMWSASFLPLYREPCSKQQVQFLACPTLPPSVGPREPPLSSRIGLPIMLWRWRRRYTSTGSPVLNNKPRF